MLLALSMSMSLGFCLYQAASIFFGWIPAGRVQVAAGVFQLFMSDVMFLFLVVALKNIPKDETV